jgi:hypothetical protein
MSHEQRSQRAGISELELRLSPLKLTVSANDKTRVQKRLPVGKIRERSNRFETAPKQQIAKTPVSHLKIETLVSPILKCKTLKIKDLSTCGSTYAHALLAFQTLELSHAD